MNKDSRIYVAGHLGLVGSAIVRRLKDDGYNNIITRTRTELNLVDKASVDIFFEEERPEYVFLAAAKVGGVHANNTYRGDFIYENLMIQTNVIHAAKCNCVKKLLFMGSNCLYPSLTSLPIKEEFLLAGKLEKTTEAYAIAKIAGIKMCEAYRRQFGCNFISVLPVNLYGQNDNYDLETSHVMPALLRKFKDGVLENLDSVSVWGSGHARREFLHVDDMADACLFLMLKYHDIEPVNIGSGEEVSIRDLALMIKDVSGFKGELVFNTQMPDGIMSKKLDVAKLHGLGWRHSITLRDGIVKTYSELK